MTTSGAGSSDGYDAIVIGSGPAGATAAYFLANYGHSVLLLEKAAYPRFHIGESLVPYSMPVFEKMGIVDFMEKHGGPYIIKPGVEVSEAGNPTVRRAPFLLMAEGQKKYAFNLERAVFDNLLLETATKAGAQTLQEAEVTSFIFDGERIAGVNYTHGGQSHAARAPYVVDASGRAGLISRQFNLRHMNPRLRNVAVFQHFEGCDKSPNSTAEGFQVLTSHDEGWIWDIPMGPTTLSIGAVMAGETLRGKDLQTIFDDHVSRSPRISASLKDARPLFSELKTESDFCYHSNKLAGPGWFMVGDAGCFVDPLFSGGVFMATMGGMRVADRIHEILGGEDEARVQQAFQDFAKTGYDSYFRLVYTFYGQCRMHILELFDALTDEFPLFIQFISGDFWGPEENPILRSLRARRDLDTFEEPFELQYERPVYPNSYWKSGDKFPERPRPPVH